VIGLIGSVNLAAFPAHGDGEIPLHSPHGLSASAGFTQARPFDPLKTAPPVLSSGVTLPGDAAPPCPGTASSPHAEAGIELRLLSLGGAVDLALCANPQLKSSWAAIKIQAAALGEAKAAYLPTATAGLSHVDDRTNYPGTDIPV